MRHRAMARNTLMCFPGSHGRFCSMNASPVARTISATSRGGRLIYFSPMGLPLMDSESKGRVLPVSLRRLRATLFRFAGLLCHHEVVIVSCALAPLKLFDDGLDLPGSLVGTGNIEGLAFMPVLKTRGADGAVHIAEDLARLGVIHVGAEPQVVRISDAAFDQFPEASGRHRLKRLSRRPISPAAGILTPRHNAHKGMLNSQAKHVQQKTAYGNAPTRQRATEKQVADTHLEQVRRDQSFRDRGAASRRPSLFRLPYLLWQLAG